MTLLSGIGAAGRTPPDVPESSAAGETAAGGARQRRPLPGAPEGIARRPHPQAAPERPARPAEAPRTRLAGALGSLQQAGRYVARGGAAVGQFLLDRPVATGGTAAAAWGQHMVNIALRDGDWPRALQGQMCTMAGLTVATLALGMEAIDRLSRLLDIDREALTEALNLLSGLSEARSERIRDLSTQTSYALIHQLHIAGRDGAARLDPDVLQALLAAQGDPEQMVLNLLDLVERPGPAPTRAA